MTYGERVNMIGTLLRDTILPRYRRPEHLDDISARAEVADMVADLNAEWPITYEDGFRTTAERFGRELRKISTSRSWPSIGHMLRALEAASKAAPLAEVTGYRQGFDPEEAIQSQLLQWTKGERDVPFDWITPQRLVALAGRGQINRSDIGGMIRFAAENRGVFNERTGR